jgi:hypothetical protein
MWGLNGCTHGTNATQSLFAGALGIPAEVMRETMSFP